VPGGSDALRPRPFAITPTPSAQERAICSLAIPSAAISNVRACTTFRCGDPVERAIFLSSTRCSKGTTTMIKTKVIGEITVEPLTMKRWTDFESLFCSAAIPGRCWCMWWRTTQKEAVANRGEGNKAAMSEKVDAGELVGLLAYVDECRGRLVLGRTAGGVQQDRPIAGADPGRRAGAAAEHLVDCVLLRAP